MSKIYIAEHHDQVLSFWKDNAMRDLKVVHFDFHCDMRGIMIDRKRHQAFFISQQDTAFVDKGNFMSHAIMDGHVRQLTWVHHENAGRWHDTGPVVSYEGDIMAPVYQMKHKLSGDRAAPVTFRQCLDKNWHGMEADEQLDLDWDALASVTYDEELQQKLITGFLDKDLKHTPEVTFLVYSPGYSNPDRSLFHDFSKELASKFHAQLDTLPGGDTWDTNSPYQHSSPLRQALKRVLPPQITDLKSSAKKWMRKRDAAGDLRFYSGA